MKRTTSLKSKPLVRTRNIVGLVVKNQNVARGLTKAINLGNSLRKGTPPAKAMSRTVQKARSIPAAKSSTSTTEELLSTPFDSKYNIISRPSTGGAVGVTMSVIPICPWQASALSYGSGEFPESDPKLEAQYSMYTHWRCLGAVLRYKGSAPNTNPARIYLGADSDPLCPPPEPSESDFSALSRSKTFVVYAEEDCAISLPISGEWKSINPAATYLALNNGTGGIGPADAKLFWDGLMFVGWDPIPNSAGLTANLNFWLEAIFQFKGRNATFQIPQMAVYNATGLTSTNLNSGASIGPGRVPRFFYDGTYDRRILDGGGYYMARVAAKIVDPAIAGTGAIAITVRDTALVDVTASRRIYHLYLNTLASGATNIGEINSPYGTSTGAVQAATFEFMIFFHAAPGDSVCVTDTVDAADTYKQLHCDITRMTRSQCLAAVRVLDPTANFPSTV